MVHITHIHIGPYIIYITVRIIIFFIQIFNVGIVGGLWTALPQGAAPGRPPAQTCTIKFIIIISNNTAVIALIYWFEVDTDVPYRADDVNHKMDGEVKTGTTIMAVQFDGGVIMGADSRTSTGEYVANRASRKVSKVHDRIFVCRSGSAADTQALTAMVQDYLGQHAISLPPGQLPKVEAAANLFRILAYFFNKIIVIK